MHLKFSHCGLENCICTTWIYFSFIFFPLVSQCNISLKKQRSRSIFSTLFCCFRDYNVEPPSTNSTSALPPLVEENGGLQKVRLLSYSAVIWVFCNRGLTLRFWRFVLIGFLHGEHGMSHRKNYCFDGELPILSIQLQFKTNLSMKSIGTIHFISKRHLKPE